MWLLSLIYIFYTHNTSAWHWAKTPTADTFLVQNGIYTFSTNHPTSFSPNGFEDFLIAICIDKIQRQLTFGLFDPDDEAQKILGFGFINNHENGEFFRLQILPLTSFSIAFKKNCDNELFIHINDNEQYKLTLKDGRMPFPEFCIKPYGTIAGSSWVGPFAVDDPYPGPPEHEAIMLNGKGCWFFQRTLSTNPDKSGWSWGDLSNDARIINDGLQLSVLDNKVESDVSGVNIVLRYGENKALEAFCRVKPEGTQFCATFYDLRKDTITRTCPFCDDVSGDTPDFDSCQVVDQ